MAAADLVLSIARNKIGLGETPPGSYHNEITSWYGADGPWCAMFVSWVLAHAGFSTDGGATLRVPNLVQTTKRGWSYVPYLLNSFRDAGLTSSTPQAGHVVIYDWDRDGVPDHTGFVERVIDNQTFEAIEGNHHHVAERVQRQRYLVAAFCSPPYDGIVVTPPPRPAANEPPFPGYCSLGSHDEATRQAQQRLVDRGWHLAVDSDFGPETARVVLAFQSQKGLAPDGIVGPITWQALWTAPITRD